MISLTDDTFEQEVSSDGVTVVDFWADWCGPCKLLAPTFEELASEYADRVKFAKVNIEETSIAQKFSIRGIPTLLFFKNGNVVNTLVGNQSKGRIQLAIDTILE